MTEQEILQQMDDLQAKLDEIRTGIVAFPVDTCMSEIEKEKQHQEDLQVSKDGLMTQMNCLMMASISSM